MLPRWLRGAPLLVLLAVGCGRSSVEQAEVSGKVLYRGKPLPGGVVTFLSSKGFSGTAAVGADGSYRLRAPVGSVKISVDNRMLRKQGAGKGGYRMARPAEDAEPQKPLAGKYVPLPVKYHSPASSGLSLHVNGETQTFDIVLQ